MNDSAASRLEALLDRAEIIDCLIRYTRGYDRNDAALMRGAFHDDGVFSIGSNSQTIEQVVAYCASQVSTRLVSQHFLSNHLVEIDGDTAHAETYWLGGSFNAGGSNVTILAGRYVDRLERRDGEWRITVRRSIPEWTVVGTGGVEEWLAMAGDRGQRRDAGDPSYERPLDGDAAI